MAIGRSPGCSCCAGCDVVEYDDLAYDLTAGELYQLPGTVNDFNKIELTHLLADGYFSHIDDWFDIGLYEYDPVQQQDVLIKTLRYQLMSLGQSYRYHVYGDYDFTTNQPVLPYPALDKWRGLGVRVDDEWHIIQPDLYAMGAGVNNVCIVGVSSGTYEKNMTYVLTALAEYNYKLEADGYSAVRWREQTCKGIEDIRYGFQKSRYVLFDGETSLSSKVFRYNRSSVDTDLRVVSEGLYAVNTVNTDHTVSSGSITSSFSRSIPEDVYRLSLYNYESQPTLKAGSSVVTYPTTSVSGSGHFEIECVNAIVEPGENLDIRVIRTGGNTEAVDVDVFYNGSTSTLSFAAGENYKTITVNSVSHSGLRSDIDRHNDPVPAIPKDKYSLNHILVRKDAWEIGTDSSEWLAKSHSTEQDRYFWYKGAIPFEKDGTTWKGSVKLKVTSSKDTRLGFYGITRFRNDATCDAADENEKRCSVHELCNTISDFSHYPIDFTDSSGDMYLPTAEKHVFVDRCVTSHLFRDEGLNFVNPKYVYRKNERRDNYVRDLSLDPVYFVKDYTAPLDTPPFVFSKDCDGEYTEYTVYTDNSNLPSGYVNFLSSSVENVTCSGYSGGSVVSTRIPVAINPPVGNITPKSISNLNIVTQTKVNFCDEWSFVGDRNYVYTDDSSSPFSEVVAKIEISPNYGSLDTPPEDQTDTSYEMVVPYIKFFGVYKGAAFRWNGSSYDMIGQDRIYVIQSMPSGNSLTDQEFIDAITQPFWFFYDGSYYYIKPNSGSALTVEGPFSSPTDTVNSVSVVYEGKKQIKTRLSYAGATSTGVMANGLTDEPGFWNDNMSPFEESWFRNFNHITDFDTTISVVDAAGTITASPIPWTLTKKVLDPIRDCSLAVCYDGPLRGDVIKTYVSSTNYGYWNVLLSESSRELCDCDNESWSLNNTSEDRNEAFAVPSSANQYCDWITCVPELNPESYSFDYCTQPSSAKAVDSIPAATEVTINYTSGDICDCPDLTSNSVIASYYDFSAVPDWDGSLYRTSSGSTSSIRVAYNLLQPFTTSGSLGARIFPSITTSGFFNSPLAHSNWNDRDSNGTYFTRYLTHQDVCDYTDFPTVTLSESDLEEPGDSSYTGGGWDYSKREYRFVTGWTLGTEQTVDWHDPDYQSGQLYDVCWKMRQFSEATMSYVDVHPRYTSPEIKKFATLWPK